MRNFVCAAATLIFVLGGAISSTDASAKAPPCDLLYGDWKWVDGNTVTFTRDVDKKTKRNIATHTGSPGNPGYWELDGKAVRIEWSFWKSTDDLLLSEDGKELKGTYGMSDATKNGLDIYKMKPSVRMTPCRAR